MIFIKTYNSQPFLAYLFLLKITGTQNDYEYICQQ